MSKWNLRDDWPQEYQPRDKNGLLIDLFSMPLPDTIPENAYNTLSLDLCTQDQKKLVIGIQSPQLVDILAMTHGSVKTSGSTLTLTSHVFSVAWLNKTLIERQMKTQQSVGIFPISWFRNWIEAGRVPSKIIYENVTGIKSGEVKAGEKIGTPALNLASPQQQQIKISVEYVDSTAGDPRFMHPREFFSLLFWDEKCDPIFQKTPDEYKHPLLRKMMTTYEDGNPASLANGASQVIKRDKDDWLGLRPPLRTFQRVKWEHIKEHLRASNNQDWDWNATESVKNRIFNKHVSDGGGYIGSMKCNVYTGEMLFRAGFRTIVWAGGYGCGAGQIQNRLKYLSPKRLDIIFEQKEWGILPGSINFSTTTACTSPSQATHSIHTCFGSKVASTKDEINQAIQGGGDVFFLTTSAHVPLIHEVKSWSAQEIRLTVMDQQFLQDPRNQPTHNYTKDVIIVTIIRALPGGDPTEDWGRLESNCLEKV